MQLTIKELSDFETKIRDNPLELLMVIEVAMHVLMRLAYSIVTLIDTMSSLFALKQGEKRDY